MNLSSLGVRKGEEYPPLTRHLLNSYEWRNTTPVVEAVCDKYLLFRSKPNTVGTVQRGWIPLRALMDKGLDKEITEAVERLSAATGGASDGATSR